MLFGEEHRKAVCGNQPARFDEGDWDSWLLISLRLDVFKKLVVFVFIGILLVRKLSKLFIRKAELNNRVREGLHSRVITFEVVTI